MTGEDAGHSAPAENRRTKFLATIALLYRGRAGWFRALRRLRFLQRFGGVHCRQRSVGPGRLRDHRARLPDGGALRRCTPGSPRRWRFCFACWWTIFRAPVHLFSEAPFASYNIAPPSPIAIAGYGYVSSSGASPGIFEARPLPRREWQIRRCAEPCDALRSCPEQPCSCSSSGDSSVLGRASCASPSWTSARGTPALRGSAGREGASRGYRRAC